MDFLTLIAGLYAWIATVAYIVTRLGLAWRERQARKLWRAREWRAR